MAQNEWAVVSETPIARTAGTGWEVVEQKPTTGAFAAGVKSYLPQVQETFGGLKTLLGVGAERVLGEGQISRGLIESGAASMKEAEAKRQPFMTAERGSFTDALNKGVGAVLTEWLPFQAGSGAAQVVEALALVGAGGLAGTMTAPGPGTLAGAGTGLVARELAKRGVKEAAEKILKERGEDAAKVYFEKAAKDVALDIGKKRGQTAALAGQAAFYGTGQTTSRAVEEAEKLGGTATDIELARVLPAAAVSTVAEFIGDKIALGALKGIKPGEPGKFVAADLAKNILLNIGLTGTKEVPVEVIQSAAERFGAKLSLTDAQALKEYIDATAASYGMAVGPGGVGGVRQTMAERAKKPEAPAPEAQPVAPPPVAPEATPEQLRQPVEQPAAPVSEAPPAEPVAPTVTPPAPSVEPVAEAVEPPAPPIAPPAEPPVTPPAPPAPFAAPGGFVSSLTLSPAYEGIEPLSVEDADFELEALQNSAEKGRLTPEQFAGSEIGKRLDTAQIGFINEGLRADPVGTITALRDRLKEATAAPPAPPVEPAPVVEAAAPVAETPAPPPAPESDQKALEEKRQMVADMIETKKANREAVPEAWIKRLADLSAQLRGETISEGETYSMEVAGHPLFDGPPVLRNLIPIKVKDSDSAQRALDRALDLEKQFATEFYGAKQALKSAKTAAEKKAAQARIKKLNDQGWDEDALQTLRNETIQELSRLVDVTQKAAPKAEAPAVEAPAPAAEMPSQEPLVTTSKTEQTLLVEATNTLSQEEQSALENHYGGSLKSAEVQSKVINDVLAYINKGAKSVAESVRKIIGKLSKALLSVAVFFSASGLNPQINTEAYARTVASMPAQVTVSQAEQRESKKADTSGRKLSPNAQRVADWIAENAEANEISQILDPATGMMYVMKGGKIVADSPALFGKAGVGAIDAQILGKPAAKMTETDKVTPAGRFALKLEQDETYGTTLTFLPTNDGGGYAIHRVYLGDPTERRTERLNSQDASDNSVSYGCVNVSNEFYDQTLRQFDYSGKAFAYLLPSDASKLSQFFDLNNKADVDNKFLYSLGSAKAQQSNFEQTLRTLLNKFGLKDVGLSIIEGMQDAGSYAQQLIRIADRADNPIRTLRHEAIHALRELGFFTDAQWKSLSKMAKDKWIDQYLKQRNVDGKPLKAGEESRYDAYMREYNGDMEKITEEAVADAFADFEASKPPAGLLQALLKRMKDLFQSIKSALTKVESVDQIFGKVEEGKLKPGEKAESGERKSVRDRATANFLRWFGDSKVVDEKGEPLVVYHGTHADISAFKKTKGAHLGFHFGDVEAANTRLEHTADSRIDTAEVERLRKEADARFAELSAFKEALRRKDGQAPMEEIAAALERGEDFLPILDRYKYQPTEAEQAKLASLDAAYRAKLLPINKTGTGSNIMPVYLALKRPLHMPDVGNWGSAKTVREALPWGSEAKTLAQIQKEIEARGYDGIIYANRVETPVMKTDSYIVFEPTQIKSAIGNNGDYSLTNPDIRKSIGGVSPGQKALETIRSMGMDVKPPDPTKLEKAKDIWKKAKEDPKLTAQSALKAARDFMDKVETWAFSPDAKLNNDFRRAVIKDFKENEGVLGQLLEMSQSQAVHADALSSQFLIDGGLKYNDKVQKWESFESKANFPALSKKLDEIGEKYGLNKEQIERVAHAYLVAKRLPGLIERNKNLDAEIAAEQASIKPDKKKIKDLEDKKVFISEKQLEQIEPGLSLVKDIPELNQVVDMWNEIRKNTIDVMVNSGLWSTEYAQQMWDNMDYVPYFRDDQIENEAGPQEFIRGLQVKSKEFQLKGSEDAVHDVFDNMIRWTQYAINRSVRAHKALQMIDNAKDIQIGDRKMAEKVTEEKRGMNIARVFRDGKQELYDMADPMYVQAFSAIQNVSIPTIKFMAQVSNVLRQSVVLYPLFSVAQVPQDAFAAMFTSGLKTQHAMKIPYLAVKEFIKTLNKTSATHNTLKKFGATGVRDFSATVIRDDAEIYAGLKPPRGGWGKTKEVLSHISMAADNAVRQAVYEASMQQGVKQSEAIEKAFDVINFRRKGTSKMLNILGQTVPFFYAYLSAQRVALKVLTGTGISPTDRKEAFQTLATTSAAVATLSLLYAMANGDDEDYMETPANIRDRTLTIPGSGGVRIPLRPDFFLFPKIIAEHTYLMLSDQGYQDGAKFRKSMADALLSAVASPTPFPTAIKPAIEVAINYDFFQGKPLIGNFEKEKALERQFRDSTSEFAKLLGATGMVSPIAADHMIRGMFGSFGGLFLYGTNQFLHSDPDVPRPELSAGEMLTALPGTSGLLKRPQESALKNDFYTLRDEVEKAVNTFNDIKTRSPQGMEDFLADEKKMARYMLGKPVDQISQRLSKIRRQMTIITNMPESQMSAQEKADFIRELREYEREYLKSVDVKALREMAKI
jgi:uncharacterized protein